MVAFPTAAFEIAASADPPSLAVRTSLPYPGVRGFSAAVIYLVRVFPEKACWRPFLVHPRIPAQSGKVPASVEIVVGTVRGLVLNSAPVAVLAVGSDHSVVTVVEYVSAAWGTLAALTNHPALAAPGVEFLAVDAVAVEIGAVQIVAETVGVRIEATPAAGAVPVVLVAVPVVLVAVPVVLVAVPVVLAAVLAGAALAVSTADPEIVHCVDYPSVRYALRCFVS